MPFETLVIEPMGAVRLTQRSLWTPRARKYAEYKATIKTALGPDYKLPEVLKLEFAITMPKSWSAKRRLAMEGSVHQSKPDIDNLVKGFMDAFGVDDSHVHTIIASKRWEETGRITVYY